MINFRFSSCTKLLKSLNENLLSAPTEKISGTMLNIKNLVLGTHLAKGGGFAGPTLPSKVLTNPRVKSPGRI